MSGAKVYKVLVVDDSAEILTLSRLLFQELPAEIVTAADGATAVALLQEGDVAVLICDLLLPDMSGTAVLGEARHYNPHVVSILSTGHPAAEAVIEAVNEGGIWKVMAKPWAPEAIVPLVREALERFEVQSGLTRSFRELATRITVTMTQHGGVQESASTTGSQAPSSTESKGKRVLVRKTGQPAQRVKIRLDMRKMLENRYRLLDVIGRGGLGTVYKAEDTLLNTVVAIKILSPEVSARAHVIDILKSEARIAMQLSHKHIVRLHTLQASPVGYFLVMEYVQGCTFRNVLTVDGALSVQTVLQVLKVSADALGYAHRHGVLHRDLKPENLMLTEDGVLKIIDFGISSLAGARVDRISGTPVYMSPEAVRGETMDRTADVYSLGVVTHELLTGDVPFPELDMELDERAVLAPVISEGVSAALRPVLERALGADSRTRWPSIEDFAVAMHQAAGVPWN